MEGGRTMAEEKQVLANVSVATVDRELRKIGETELEIGRLEADMTAQVDQIKKEFEVKLRPQRQTLDMLRQRLEETCRQAREDLFAEGSKTLKLAFGSVSFRALPGTVKVKEGTDEEAVIRKLAKMFPDHYYVRVKESVDRDGLRRAAERGDVTAKQLAQAGLEWEAPGEKFVAKADREAAENAGKV